MLATCVSASGLYAEVGEDAMMAPPEVVVEESNASSGSAANMIFPLVLMYFWLQPYSATKDYHEMPAMALL